MRNLSVTKKLPNLSSAALPRETPLLAILACIAFLVRVAFMVYTGDLWDQPIYDEVEYHLLAQNLVAGEGYTVNGVQVVNRPPAYPVMLALIYSVFGPSVEVARVVTALLTALLIPLIYYIGQRAWGRNVGLLAAGLFTFYPFSIVWAPKLYTENLSTALFVLLGALLVRPAEAKPLRLLGAGVVIGLALLTRANAVLVAAGLFIWIPFAVGERRRAVRSLALLTAGTILVLVPWIARNAITFGQFVPLTSGSSTGGYVFWNSNNAIAADPEGGSWGAWITSTLLPELPEYERLPNDPALLDRTAYGYGFRFLAENPEKVPVLLLGKFIALWGFAILNETVTRIMLLLGLLLLPLFLFGLWEMLRKPALGGMPIVFILGVVLTALIYYGEMRIRAPAEPYIVLAIAIGVHRMAQQERKRLSASKAGRSRPVLAWGKSEVTGSPLRGSGSPPGKERSGGQRQPELRQPELRQQEPPVKRSPGSERAGG